MKGRNTSMLQLKDIVKQYGDKDNVIKALKGINK